MNIFGLVTPVAAIFVLLSPSATLPKPNPYYVSLPAPPSGVPFTVPVSRNGSAPSAVTADRVGLLSLLHHRRYSDLTRALEAYQKAFESDHGKEYWVLDAVEAFANADPRLEPLLDEWARVTPRSFAAFAARGSWRFSLAARSRGGGWGGEVTPDRRQRMEAEAARAQDDLQRAIALRPGLVAGYSELLRVALLRPPAEPPRELLSRALHACPGCLNVRILYASGLRPRWGGSSEVHERFLRTEAAEKKDPRLGILLGYLDGERRDEATMRGDAEGALRAAEAAIGRGEHWQFYFDRGDLLWRFHQYERALADYDRALELRPQMSSVLEMRSDTFVRIDRIASAARDILLALRLSPVDPRTYLVPEIVSRLLATAESLERAVEPVRTDLLDIVLQLDYANARARALYSGPVPSEEVLAARRISPSLDALVVGRSPSKEQEVRRRGYAPGQRTGGRNAFQPVPH